MAELRPTGTLEPPAHLLLPLLCWVLVFPCVGAMALQPPSITLLSIPTQLPSPGKSMTVSCEATSSLPELTLLYWLGNGSFVEKLHPDVAVQEGMMIEEPQGSGVALRRDLHFSSFSTQHLHINFTCVVLSPAGFATKDLQWPLAALAPAPAESGGLG